eukprot:gene5289-8907_t
MTSSLNLDEQLTKVLPEWNDDKVMSYLMQNFKFNRSVNPEDWDKKLKFWSRVILESAKFEDKFCISISKIKQYICRKERNSNKTNSPLGWKTVLNEMQKKNEIIEYTEFLNIFNESQRQSFGSWLLNTVFIASTSYFWNYENVQTENFSDETNFVVMSIVKEKTEMFMKKFNTNVHNSSDLFITPFQLKEFFTGYNQMEIKILLNYIHTNCKYARMVKLSNENIEGLKLSGNEELEVETSDTDINILHLKRTLFKVENQINKLENEIKTLKDEIKENVRNPNKSKWILKKIHLLEEILSKRNISHFNLIQILSAIDSSQTNMEIHKVLKNGAETLKTLTSKLTDMNVDNIINSAADALSDYDEIQHAMEYSLVEDKFDEDELEKELKALNLEDKTEIIKVEEYIVIPFEEIKGSKSILEFEIKETENLNDKNLMKYKEDLNLGLKLLKLKMKRRNQSFLDTLNEMKQKFESKAIEEEGSKKSLKFMKYVELIEQDIKEMNEIQITSPRISKTDSKEINHQEEPPMNKKEKIATLQ